MPPIIGQSIRRKTCVVEFIGVIDSNWHPPVNPRISTEVYGIIVQKFICVDNE